MFERALLGYGSPSRHGTCQGPLEQGGSGYVTQAYPRLKERPTIKDAGNNQHPRKAVLKRPHRERQVDLSQNGYGKSLSLNLSLLVSEEGSLPSRRRPGRSSSPRSCRRSSMTQSSGFRALGLQRRRGAEHRLSGSWKSCASAALHQWAPRTTRPVPRARSRKASPTQAKQRQRAPHDRIQLPVDVLVALVPRIQRPRKGIHAPILTEARLGQGAARRSPRGRQEATRAPRAALGRRGRGHRDTRRGP